MRAHDPKNFAQALRVLYHRMPLPVLARNVIGRTFRMALAGMRNPLRRHLRGRAPARLPSVRPAVQQGAVPDYIVWGVIDWHFRHQRPQHLARALAASGRRVFYVSACLDDDARAGFSAEALDSDGRLFQVRLFVPGAPAIYASAPGAGMVSQLRAGIGRVLEWADCGQVISLVQHPFWHEIARVLPNSRLVYDCMDHHAGFGNNGPDILSLERALVRDAELTIVSSVPLDRRWAAHARRRALIRNAADFAFFSCPPASCYHDPQGRPVIGYYGAIAEWFDQGLVAAVAGRFPRCSILLIGTDTVNAGTTLCEHPNITFIGEVPYVRLPYFLHGFDVCLLPFRINSLTLATNPVKVYEFLSAGKPVVSVDLPEMHQFGELVRVAAGTEAFLSGIARVLDHPTSADDLAARQAFAGTQAWPQRAAALIAHCENAACDSPASVIVVTYNNLQLTRACLASMEVHGDDEPVEVIVVDNGSTDGTCGFLKSWAAAAANRRVVLNPDNRGFAAAANQGLAAAAGEYLVLLNNDTQVTPGWLRTLKNHLRRDRGLGLIGPVTNSIGNEAKVDLVYDSMDDMLLSAARFTRRHIGEVFMLRTLAFFCVMMPRGTYEQVGPLDEAYGRGYFEDDDYCRRVEQAGLRIACARDVFVHHQLSASFNQLRSRERQALFARNKAIYEARWGEWIPHTYGEPDP